MLAWNAMSSALLGDWTALRPARRNHPRLRFLPPTHAAGPLDLLPGTPSEHDSAPARIHPSGGAECL